MYSFLFWVFIATAGSPQKDFLTDPHVLNLFASNRFDVSSVEEEATRVCAKKTNLNREEILQSERKVVDEELNKVLWKSAKEKGLDTIKDLKTPPEGQAVEEKLGRLDLELGKLRQDFRECVGDIKAKNPPDVVLDVFDRPNPNGKKLGQLRLVVRSKFHEVIVIDAKGASTTMYSQEVPEYEGPAGISILAAQGSWIKLPKNPLPSPFWVNVAPLGQLPKPQPISKDGWYDISTPTFSGTVKFEKLEKDFYVASYTKPPLDLNCDTKDRKVERFRVKIPVRELFDSDMHLKAKPANIGYCTE